MAGDSSKSDGMSNVIGGSAPAARARATILLHHGAVGNRSSALTHAGVLHGLGCNMFLYDYEGFGGSTGTASLSTLRSDLETVVDWTLRRTGEGRVSLFGISLGTMPTVAVAVDRPAMINGVVLDSPIALGLEIERFAFLIRNQTDAVIAALEPWLLSEQVIDQMLQPMLIYEHGQDIITPPKEVELLFERAGGPKEIVRYPDLDHARGQFVETADYDAHMEAFLANVWSPPTDP